MDKKLEEQLVKEFPNLYKNYDGDVHHTPMGWGFTCNDGWFDLIKELSSKLEPHGIVAAQVKEKFGGLRFYTESCPEDKFDKISKIIDKAESLSYKICEKCGKPGKRRIGAWVRTLCDECERNVS